MPAGAITTVEGTGSLKFSATANLLTSINPLATVSAPIPSASLQVTGGGALRVGASFELSGGYQIRIQKLNQNTVRLGYYKSHSSDFEISVSANVGVAGRVGNFEMISALLSVVSSDAKADVTELQKAGLGDEQIGVIAAAIEAGIQRKLELALSGELGAAARKEAAFLFEIDLGALDATGLRAIRSALHGDLSALVGHKDSLPSGVRVVRSIFTSIHQGKHTLKVNLLGIYNWISISQLTLKGTILCEPESGDLVISDAANAQRFRSSAVNFAADSVKLRRVLAESFLITAVYRGTGLVARAPQLKTSHWYFELHGRTNRQTMRDGLDMPQALGLISEQQKQQIVGETDDFGRSTFYAETNYDDNLTTTFFLDQAGQPRSEDDYDNIGRAALRCLIHPGDADEFRLPPLQNDVLWEQMKVAGPSALNTVLSDLPSNQLAVIAADYKLIRWWAQAMRGMGEKLAELRTFFAQNPSPGPDDNTLKTLRKALADRMKSVAQNTKEEFGHPWGLVAMDQASGGKAGAFVRITAARLALQLERPAPLPAPGSDTPS